MTKPEMPRQAGKGLIVTLYSYKGGTGRTMAVANVAWILASHGNRVLVVDWDLESPGLHRYFHPMLADPQLQASDGVIDLVRDHAAAAVSRQHATDAGVIDVRPDVRRYAVSIDWRFAGGGELDLLPAGRQGPAYSKTVSTFDWASFYDGLGGAGFLADLRENLRDHYDYVLIDSRTGLSDSAGICTVLLPDVVVNCFTLSTQSIDGAVAVARSIQNQRGDVPVRILPVPMRVEEGEQSKLDAGRDYAWVRFAPFLAHLEAEAMARYWADVEIPYKVFYAYEEILAVFGDRARQPATLLAAYERLAGVISAGRTGGLPAMDESVRRFWLGKYERTRPRAMVRVLVSFVAEDRMWAEWISGVLAQVGLATVLRDVSLLERGEQPDLGTDLIAVLLSANYRLPDESAALLRAAASTTTGRGRTNILPISLDGSPPPAQLERYGSLDLAGMSAERARAALLAALNWPVDQGTPRVTEADQPRFPGTPPRVLHLPRRNPAFTGRAALLTGVRERLSAGTEGGRPLVLTGLGGIGKTQIAIEYAHRFSADYDVVWFVSSAQASMVRSDLTDLADALGVPTAATAERLRMLRDMLTRGLPYPRWLLLFDNAREPADLRELIPAPGGAGHVLVTSRNQEWLPHGEPVEVRPFGRQESIELLRHRMPALTAGEADKVAELLGDLPLAIEQAGSWLAATAMPVDRYLALVERQTSRMLAENPPAEYPQAGELTWLLTLEQLRREAPVAARLVELLAFFGPEPIPASLLYSRAFIDAVAGEDASLRDEVNFGRLITQASRFALATFDEAERSIQMHRLVQAVVRESLPPPAAERHRRSVHEILYAAMPPDSERQDTWPQFAALLPHIAPSGALRSRSDDVRQLVLDAARFLFRRGDHSGSAELVDAALREWSQHWPADDLRLLIARIFLANALRAQGDYGAARRLDEQAYRGLMDSVGPENQYSIMCMAGLAADCWVAAEYARARELNEQALVVSEQLFGADHLRTYRAMNNLGVSMEQIGDYRGALELHRRAFLGRRTIVGDRHYETLASATSYGRVLRLTGDLRGSRRALDSAVAGYRAIFGDDHYGTLRASVELAATLRRLGELDQAEEIGRDAFATYRSTMSATHTDRLSCANILALTLSAMGNQAEAMELGMQSADRLSESLGEDHPFTLAVRSNVAVFLRRAGELEAARGLAEEVAARLAGVLGSQCPYALQSTITEASALFACGEQAAALELERTAYRDMSQVLGRTHPDRLVAGGNLVVTRQAVGEHDGLAELRAELETAAVRALGRTHPITISLRNGDRMDCEIDLSQF